MKNLASIKHVDGDKEEESLIKAKSGSFLITFEFFLKKYLKYFKKKINKNLKKIDSLKRKF
jgi:hypothetical protein